jgi:hypothetical protein
MVARAYAPEWNLRDRWETATQEYQRLDAFIGEDGLPILQLIALHDRSDVRQPALLALSPDRVREAWDRAVISMDEAISRAQDFGTSRPEWLPYPAQLLTLGGLAWDNAIESHKQLVERWYWASSLGGTYDVGSSTRVVSDVRTLRSAMDGQAELERPFISLDSLVSATRRRSPATWRTFMSLLTRARARDPVTGQPVTGSSGQAPGATSSVFPVSRSSGESYHLRVFGQLRIARETARLTKERTLTQVLMEKSDDSNEVDARLASQFLPPLSELVGLMADPIALLEARVDRALGFLREELDDDLVHLARSSE